MALLELLKQKFAEIINKGDFLEDTAYYILDTQLHEDRILFLVGNDYADSEWITLRLE